MVMLGFKADWQKDTEGLKQYIDVIHHGFDIQLAMGILRLSKGCDFSNVIACNKEEDDVFVKNGESQNSENGKYVLTVNKCGQIYPLLPHHPLHCSPTINSIPFLKTTKRILFKKNSKKP